jgi:hypothetical protein
MPLCNLSLDRLPNLWLESYQRTETVAVERVEFEGKKHLRMPGQCEMPS